jgi:hypothetical protein
MISLLETIQKRRPLWNAVVVALVVGVGAGGLRHLWLLGQTFYSRVAFPLDLEWMEGGTLVHALRLAQGKGIYVEPSVDFIPFLYTPFYPFLLSILSRLAPLGYVLGRSVSIAAFTGALFWLVFLCQREMAEYGWRRRLVAVAVAIGGAGAVCAGFEFTGTFYDLVRGDSLMLFLVATVLALAFIGQEISSAALAGAIIALAFFTKQTASIPGIAIGLGLLIANWRRGVIYGLVAVGCLGIGGYALEKASGGWFRTYVFELHQSHGFSAEQAFRNAPLKLATHTWPLWLALLAVVFVLWRVERLRRVDAVLLLSAVAGVVSAMVGFGTQWAFDNAFIPAVFFPAFALSVLGTRAVGLLVGSQRPLPELVVATALALLALQSFKTGRPDPKTVPTDQDSVAASRFLEHLRGLPGDGFVPFHPYYSVLVGKRPFVHRMGIFDVAAKLGRPRGLDEAIATQRFPWIVLDWKSRPNEWPGLDEKYHTVHTFQDGVDSARSMSGAETSPRFVLTPTAAPRATEDGVRRLGSFDLRHFEGWIPEGDAFGRAPVPTREFGQGDGVADSAAGGIAAVGVLRSPTIRIDAPMITFLLAGDNDRGLRVFLLVDGEIVRESSPRGAAEIIRWDVAKWQQHDATLVVEDRSERSALRIDEVSIRAVR